MGQVDWGIINNQPGIGSGGNAFDGFDRAQARMLQQHQQAEQRRQFDMSHGLQQQQFGLHKNADQRAQSGEAHTSEEFKWKQAAQQIAQDDQTYKQFVDVHDKVNGAQTPEDRTRIIQGSLQAKMITPEQAQRYSTDFGWRHMQAQVTKMKQDADMALQAKKAGTSKTEAEGEEHRAKAELWRAQATNQDQHWTPHPTDATIIINRKTGEYRKIEDAIPGGKVTPGYRANADGSWQAIPGGPADIKMNEKRQTDFASMGAMNQSLDALASHANEIKSHPGLAGNYGLRGAVPNIPGSKEADAWAKMATLKAKSAFTTLQDMRNSSKTGGALGAVSDKEMALLQAAIAALDHSQSHEQITENLSKIIDYTERAKGRIAAAYNDHWNNAGAEARKTAVPTPPPITPGAVVQHPAGKFLYKGGNPADPTSWEKMP